MYSLIYLFIYQLIYLKFLARSKISGANNTKADLCEQETKIEALRENMVYMPSIEELKSLDYKFDELLERIRIDEECIDDGFSISLPPTTTTTISSISPPRRTTHLLDRLLICTNFGEFMKV